MKRSIASLVGIAVVAAVLACGAMAATHGFKDPNAPREAQSILGKIPSVDNVKCHWKVRGHTIGCTALVNGSVAQLDLWSGGSYVLYKVCAFGTCANPTKAHHIFGKPY